NHQPRLPLAQQPRHCLRAGRVATEHPVQPTKLDVAGNVTGLPQGDSWALRELNCATASALWHESIQSRSDAGVRRDTGIVRIGRVVDSSASSKLDFAAGSVAHRVTPFVVGR